MPPKTLGLVHLRASQINGCAFCVDSGVTHAKQAGENLKDGDLKGAANDAKGTWKIVKGSGNAVLAHDNPFNRWVAGPGALYFRDPVTCSVALEQLLSGRADLARMRQDNRERVGRVFVWQQILQAYASLLDAIAHQKKTRATREDHSIWKQHTT